MTAAANPVRGYAYVEVMVAVVILGICLAPMMTSLTNNAEHIQLQQHYAKTDDYVQTRMQELLVADYAGLDAEAQLVADAAVATSYSDTAGAVNRRLVFLSRYDLDNADNDKNPFTGGDSGLLWIQVTSETGSVSYETLRAGL